MQNYAIWIQTVLLLISKQKISMKLLEMMLKNDLIHQIMKSIDHYLQEKNLKKVIGLMKKELGGKIMTEFAALRPKTYSYVMMV